MNKEKEQRLSQLKKESKAILEEESKKLGAKIDINPLTLVEYYKSDIFKQKTTLQKIQRGYSLINAGGFYDSETSEIVIFVDRMGYSEKVNSINKLAAVIQATYHEYKHQLQHMGKTLTKGQKFIIEIERCLISLDNSHYKKHHNEYFMEIDADIYGTKRTYEYMAKQHPDEINETKIYLDKRLSDALHNRINYDSQKMFDKFYKRCKQKNYQINTLNVPNIFIFIDNNNEFYPLKRIMKAYQMGAIIDELTLLTVLGSKSYLKNLNYQSLTIEEKQFMLNIINKILENEVKRIDKNIRYYEGRKVKTKQYLKIITNITDKIKFLNHEISNLTIYKIKTITDKLPSSHYKNLKNLQDEIKQDIINNQQPNPKRK